MSGPPESLIEKIHNRLWRLRRGRPPALSHFAATPDAAERKAHGGEMATLVFANEGEIVHKWLHYLPIYDTIFSRFRGTNVRFLEIGVFNGGSQKIWREYFGGEATIFGIDIDPACARYDGKFSQVRIGSQDDPAFLSAVVEEMGGVDVVLDDGSHIARHQRASYETLFPLLSEDGIYAIEDLHTAYWTRWGGGLRRPGTGIEFLKDRIDDMHAHYVTEGRNSASAMGAIESIQFFDSIAVVHKRRQGPRKHFMVPEPPDL